MEVSMLNFDKVLEKVIFADYWEHIETGIYNHKLNFNNVEIIFNELKKTAKIIKPLGTKLVGFILTKSYPVPILSGIGKELYIGSQKASKEMDKKLLEEIHENISNLDIIQIDKELMIENVLDDIYADAVLNGLGIYNKNKEEDEEPGSWR
jgi:hypothetical protein